MNLGLSHEEGLRHRDWLVMDADGRTYQQNRLDSFFRQMCYNTGYGDHAVAMAREVLETTGVDGLFLDCMHTRPCFGVLTVHRYDISIAVHECLGNYFQKKNVVKCRCAIPYMTISIK